jgi:hypothetical protein
LGRREMHTDFLHENGIQRDCLKKCIYGWILLNFTLRK